MSHQDYILKMLGLEDKNIIFSEIITERKQNSVVYKVFHATLSYFSTCCSKCGCTEQNNIIKHGTKTSYVKLLPMAGFPCVLALRKQRFLCKSCGKTFVASTSLVKKHCFISNPVKQHILNDLTYKLSEKDIARMHFVSHSTVSKCIDRQFSSFAPDFDFLPESLCFDEFKSTKNAKGAMSFIFCDAANHRLLDIVENRQLCSLRNYFLRYSKAARSNVKAICIDLYSPYISLINELFPNASIVLDRFHIVQLLSRSLIKTRIHGMKQFPTSSIAYKRLKRYWKLLLLPAAQLNYTKFSRWIHFKSFACSASVVEETISVDDTLKTTYEAYQAFLQDIKQKDAAALKNHLLEYSATCSDFMKVAIKTLLQHFTLVENSLQHEISNGCLEGINNYVKTLKKITFGYRSFFHFKNRILIAKKLIVPLL